MKPSNTNLRKTRLSPYEKQPHKLALYRQAVQSPWVAVNMLTNMHASLNPGRWPTLLREDFAGSAALSVAWVLHDHDHHALAIDNHGPTVRYARKQARIDLGDNLNRLTIHQTDVMDIVSPKSDVTASLNFSINIYHQRDELIAYFLQARKNLKPGGILVCDTYGGPGAGEGGKQKRRIKPQQQGDAPAFDYIWQQKDVDPLTGLVDCRIHFKLNDGSLLENAFVYHWRLWSLPELTDCLREAGFSHIQVWAEDQQGQWGPCDRIGPVEAFLAYVVAQK